MWKLLISVGSFYIVIFYWVSLSFIKNSQWFPGLLPHHLQKEIFFTKLYASNRFLYTSGTMLTSSGDTGHSSLVSGLRENTCSVSQSRKWIVLGIRYIYFYHGKKESFK